MNYRPFIDGLRALAVLAVLCFHAGLGCPGGYVGVDIFFVLSGYLITGIILKDLERDRFSMVEFWQRRIRRILPMLTLVIGVSLLLGVLFLFPRDFKRLGQSVLAQGYMGANFHFAQAGDYFASETDIKPLLHTWSLAVEEQFYLFFPLLLWLVRRWPRPRLVAWLMGGSVLSLGLSVWGVYHYPTATFYMLPTRAWELGLGASLVAVSSIRYVPPRWLAELCGGLGVLALGYALFAYTAQTPFPGLAALPPVLGTGLIIWANERHATGVGKLLAWRGLVGLGLISYSLYLWHWPLLAFATYWFEPLSLPVRLGLMVLSIALAVGTWKYVETPFRRRRWFASRRQIFGFAIITVALVLVVGVVIRQLPSFAPWGLPVAARAHVQEQTANYKAIKQYERKLAEVRRGNYYEFGPADHTRPIQLLVWGDSHCQSVMSILETLAQETAQRGVAVTYPGMAPLLGYDSLGKGADQADQYHTAVIEYVRQQKIPQVLLVAAWRNYDDGSDRLTADFTRTIQALHTAGATVWIMKMVPTLERDVTRALVKAEILAGNPNEMVWSVQPALQAGRHQDQVLEQLPAPGVRILDPKAYLLDAQGLCRVVVAGRATYYDPGHISIHGASLLRPMFTPIFTGAAVPTTTQHGP